MPHSEDQALWSLAGVGAGFYALKRSDMMRWTYTRLFTGCLLVAWWQRFLASGKSTWKIGSNFYQPLNPPKRHSDECYEMPLEFKGQHTMEDKVVLVTGCSPGSIGFHTATQLFRMGAHVIVTTRGDKRDKEELLARIVTESRMRLEASVSMLGRERIHFVDYNLDKDIEDETKSLVQQVGGLLEQLGEQEFDYNKSALSGIASTSADQTEVIETEKALKRLKKRSLKIDCLVNNLGAMYPLGDNYEVPFHPVISGIERHFATNDLAPILLTETLERESKLANDARIVHVASRAHSSIRSVSDCVSFIQGRACSKRFHDYYSASKFINVAYAAEKNKQIQQEREEIKVSGTLSNKKNMNERIHVAVHPGVSLTSIFAHTPAVKFFNNWGLNAYLEGLTALVFKSPKEAAHTSVHCCVDRLVPSQVKEKGQFYYVDCAPGNKYLSKIAANQEAREECMAAAREIIDNTYLNRKRKMELRMNH